MRAGQKVRITKGDRHYSRAGDFAILLPVDESGLLWGNFNGLGNDAVYDDGIWCIAQRGGYELIGEE